MTKEDANALAAMRRYGSSFVKSIAYAAGSATFEQYERLKAAFPELWKHYAELSTKRDVLTP